MKEIYFAGGCFWGLEKYFDLVDGVTATSVGYANGKSANPTYEDVSWKNTGHAEAVKVIYDQSIVSLERLLTLFYEVIDPISINRQGNDRGPQYRSGVYYIDQQDRDTIEKSIVELQKKYDKPIVVEVKPLENYYLAEEYHQKYLDKNPGGYCHIGSDKFAAAAKSRTEA